MYRKILIIMLVVGFMTSCDSSLVDNKGVIHVNVSNNSEQYLPLSIAVGDVESVKMKLPVPYFWGIICEVISWNNNYFFVDKKQNIIFRFDKKGTFLNTIGKRGQGPGEYTEMSSFFVSNNVAFVCDIVARSIHSYSFDGKYLGTVLFSHSLVFDDIVALSNGNFLCHRLSDDENGKGLWVMSKDGKKLKTLLEYEEGTPYVYSDWNTLCVQEDGMTQIYNPSDGRYYQLDMANDTVFETIRLKADRDMLVDLKATSRDMLDGKKECAYSLFTVNGKHSILSYWSLTPENKIVWTICQKEDKTVQMGVLPKMDIAGYSEMGRPVSSNIPNALVTVYTDEFPKGMFPDSYKDDLIDEQIAVLTIQEFK